MSEIVQMEQPSGFPNILTRVVSNSRRVILPIAALALGLSGCIDLKPAETEEVCSEIIGTRPSWEKIPWGERKVMQEEGEFREVTLVKTKLDKANGDPSHVVPIDESIDLVKGDEYCWTREVEEGTPTSAEATTEEPPLG